MKTHILYTGLVLAALILGPAAESRLLAQEPTNRVGLENVNPANSGFQGAGSVAFSPDGKTLAAAYTDQGGTIRLWDAASGKNSATLEGGRAVLCSVAFSPDGKTLASAGADIILWDVGSRKKIAVLGNAGSPLVFSPDGKTLASGGAEITLWDVASGKKTAALGKASTSLAFSPDGKTLASGGTGNPPSPTIELWDAASATSIAVLKDEEEVWCVAFSADNKTLAAGGAHTLRLWDTATHKKTATLSAWTTNYPPDCVRSVTFSPDGKTLATGSMCQVKFWNVATGAKMAHFTAHPHWVNSVAFAPDGKTFASASYNSHNHPMVKLWDLSASVPAQAQERGISGKWAGTNVNDWGIKSEDSLEITENEDGTLTGTASGMKIENGERVTAAVLQWEHVTQTHHWRVRCNVKGKSLVLDYTCTSKENGKVKGGTGTSVLTRLAPIAYVPDLAAKKELANWQGTWKALEPGVLLTIDGDKWTWADLQGKPLVGGTIRILGVHEKIIKADLIHETGEVSRPLTLAIFRVEGDTLFYNGAYPPDSRPTAFKPGAGWQRVKKQVVNTELEKLQGTWTLFSFEIEGTQVSDRDKRETFTIKGDTWIVKVGEDIESGIIKFVEGRHCFDLVRTGEKYKGLTTQAIFQVEGDTMKYCARGRDEQALGHPTSFTTKPGDGTFLAVYKRVPSVLPNEAPSAHGQERQAEPEVPADLLKAQVASSGEAYRLRLAGYRGGEPNGDLESTYLWSVRLLSAERDLSKKPADRVAAAAAHLERMKTVEATATARVKAGGAPRHHALAAEFYRVQAQIWLSQAKGK
jgi:uncharacterized protein (TIGR03067 family)